MMHYADRLYAAVERTGNPCLLGIDPHLDLLPDEFAVVRDPRASRSDRADALARFGLELVDVAAGRVPAVKPQSAFFEQLGADGVRAFERVVDAARDAELLVIGDVKRSDISSTARAYAVAHLEGLPGLEGSGLCDAITVNPMLGRDSVEPFLEVCDRTGKGLYVLVRTSNPGSADYQRHGEPELSELLAQSVAAWGAERLGTHGWSSVGAVVGATHSSDLEHFRELMPNTPFLLPGYGAQGASAADIVGAFRDGPHGGLVNSSRGIAFASRKPEHAGVHWKDAARDALTAMIDEISGALGARRGS
jgi:orotidine-5'-phosphate decarboxylase